MGLITTPSPKIQRYRVKTLSAAINWYRVQVCRDKSMFCNHEVIFAWHWKSFLLPSAHEGFFEDHNEKNSPLRGNLKGCAIRSREGAGEHVLGILEKSR